MFDPLDILLLSLGYLLTLFAIAYVGDRYCQTLVQQAKPLLIALAGTYTTAWMFFGTPAQADSNGWYIPPTLRGYCAVQAPSIGSVVPVMVRANSPHKYNTNWPMFSGGVMSGMGCLSVISFRFASSSGRPSFSA